MIRAETRRATLKDPERLMAMVSSKMACGKGCPSLPTVYETQVLISMHPNAHLDSLMYHTFPAIPTPPQCTTPTNFF